MEIDSSPESVREGLARATRLAGLTLSEEELDALAPFVHDQAQHLEALSRIEVDPVIEPDVIFVPGKGADMGTES